MRFTEAGFSFAGCISQGFPKRRPQVFFMSFMLKAFVTGAFPIANVIRFLDLL